MFQQEGVHGEALLDAWSQPVMSIIYCVNITSTNSAIFPDSKVLVPTKSNLSAHLAPLQSPPGPKRSHIVPTTHTHLTADYGATNLLRQVGGGRSGQAGGFPPQGGGMDLHMGNFVNILINIYCHSNSVSAGRR